MPKNILQERKFYYLDSKIPTTNTFICNLFLHLLLPFAIALTIVSGDSCTARGPQGASGTKHRK